MIRVRSTMFLSLVALAATAVVATAMAQPPGGRRGGEGQRRGTGGGFGVSISGLLRVEKVRTEVKVTEKQQEQLQELGEQRRSGMGDRYARLREMSEEDRRKEIEKIRAERAKQGEERAKEMAKILNEKQIARLNEIRRQVLGFRALGEPDVIKELGITEDQGAKLTKIREELSQKTREGFSRTGGGEDLSGEQRMARFQERMKKVSQMQDEAIKKATDTVMTTSQKEKWETLIGEDFEISFRDLMQGRGGPRGRGQGGPPSGRPGGRGAGGRGPGGRGGDR